jgi:hypothetical protein
MGIYNSVKRIAVHCADGDRVTNTFIRLLQSSIGLLAEELHVNHDLHDLYRWRTNVFRRHRTKYEPRRLTSLYGTWCARLDDDNIVPEPVMDSAG